MKHVVLTVFMLIALTGCTTTKPNDNLYTKLPGSSVASPQLQQDALSTVYSMVIISRPESCKQMAVTNTRVTKEPYDVAVVNDKVVNAKWSEEWTVNACNTLVVVPISFVQVQSGTTFFVNKDDIKSK